MCTILIEFAKLIAYRVVRVPIPNKFIYSVVSFFDQTFNIANSNPCVSMSYDNLIGDNLDDLVALFMSLSFDGGGEVNPDAIILIFEPIADSRPQKNGVH